MVNCKVCETEVPPRNNYHRTICGACQKFFRRHCQQRYKLACLTGKNNCIVNSRTRKRCLRCRLEKSIRIGMKSKYLDETENDITYSNPSISPTQIQELSSHSTTKNSIDCSVSNKTKDTLASAVQISSTRVATLPLVRDPVVFDGGDVESLTRHAVGAFALLHGYEFMALRRTDVPLGDMLDLGRRLRQHFLDGIRTSLTYMTSLMESLKIPHDATDLLNHKAVRQVFRLYLVLPCNTLSDFRYSGINEKCVPFMEKHFPELQELHALENDMTNDLAQWNPPFVICTLLCALLLFNGKAQDGTPAVRIRQRLWLALDLIASKLAGGNALALWQMLENCRRCLQKNDHVSARANAICNAMAQRLPALTSAAAVLRPYA